MMSGLKKLIIAALIIGAILLIIIGFLTGFFQAFKPGGIADTSITSSYGTGGYSRGVSYSTNVTAAQNLTSTEMPAMPTYIPPPVQPPVPAVMPPAPSYAPTIKPSPVPVIAPSFPPMPGPVDFTEYEKGWAYVLEQFFRLIARMFNIYYP